MTAPNPEGDVVLVPREPTDEMLDAAVEEMAVWGENGEGWVRGTHADYLPVWRAMLSAAPAALQPSHAAPVSGGGLGDVIEAAKEAGWAMMEVVDGVAWERREQFSNIAARLAKSIEAVEGLYARQQAAISAGEEVSGSSADADTQPGAEGAVVGWQPIETAPKDGSCILVIDQSAMCPKSGAAWFAEDVWTTVDPSATDDMAEDVRRDLLHAVTWVSPTHWMPLPAAPDAISTDEQVGTKPKAECAKQPSHEERERVAMIIRQSGIDRGWAQPKDAETLADAILASLSSGNGGQDQ